MTYAKTARGMFDHLNAAHRYDAEVANSVVTALAKASGWSLVKPFDPKRPRSATPGGARSGVVIKPRPTTPPPDTWEELVHYLIDIMHVIHRDRHIPKYQFERHVDSLLVPFLPEILAWRLGGVFQVVASEFPIKKVENDQSTNADALLHQRGPIEQPDSSSSSRPTRSL